MNFRSIVNGCQLTILALLLTGCTSRVLIDQQQATESRPAADGKLVSVPFITNRKLESSGSDDHYFGEHRGTLTGGACQVALRDPDELRGKAEVVRVVQSEQSEVLQGIDASNGVILYVHGYNIGFEKGCRRVARMQQSLGIEGRTLLFSWPADGNYLNYLRDVSDLSWSEPALTALLARLASQFGPGNVHLVGHSLGARGLVNALVRLATTESLSMPFNQLILAAPDIDRDLFRRDLDILSGVVSTTTVYTSSEDKPLAMSHRLNGYARLGQALDYPAGLPRVNVVDVSVPDTREVSGHLYHLYNPAAVEDLRYLLGTLEAPRRFVRAADDSGFQLRPDPAPDSPPETIRDP